MITEKKYLTANGFLFACVTCSNFHPFPLIHWNDEDKRGYIFFKLKVDDKFEFHTFHSHSKKLLDAIWNSIGLVRHAVKLVEDAHYEKKTA